MLRLRVGKGKVQTSRLYTRKKNERHNFKQMFNKQSKGTQIEKVKEEVYIEHRSAEN